MAGRSYNVIMAIAPLERPPSPPQRGVPKIPDWSAAGWASLLGGLAFMGMEMFLAPLFGQGRPWDAPRLIAAVLVGDLLQGQAPTTVFILSLSIHLTLSLLFGRLLALLLFKRPRREWVAIGLLFGLGLYLFNYHALGTFSPRIEAARSVSWLFCHLVFGLVTAAAYRRLERSP